MNAFNWILELNSAVCGFWSNEKPKQKASNAEIKRWFLKNCVVINGEIITNIDKRIDIICNIVLFPNNDKKRISFKFN